MHYRTIPNTNLQTSIIGLGCEGFEGKSAAEVKEMFDVAISSGVNYLDLFLPQPDIRTNIGLALKGRREKMIIQGHICTIFEDGQYTRSRDFEKVKASFEDLLKCLDTDYIDIGMIHFVDGQNGYNSVFNTEIYDYIKELKEKGIIKYIGMSSHNPEIALKAVLAGKIDVLMFSINPAFDFEDINTNIYAQLEFKGLGEADNEVDSLRSELYLECEKHGVAITVMKTFAAGRLLNAETSPFGKALTVPQCIEYALSRPGVVNVIVGSANSDEIRESVAYCEATKESRDYSHIFESSMRFAMSGNCMYCNHCKPCASNIDIAMVTKLLDIAMMQDTVSETVMQHYKSLEYNAMDCLQCATCEPRCPFGVKITENMRRAQRIFH